MQTQDASADFIFKLWPWIEANKNRLIGGLVVILAGAGIGYYISAERAQKEIDAGQALTALLDNPSGSRTASQMATALESFAATYAGTAAAGRAQVQAAATLFDAGNYADAQAQFKKYLDAEPAGPLADSAELGVAASLEAQNQTSLAEAAYRKVISAFPNSASAAPADFALGEMAEQQNRLNEAMSDYENAARASLGGSLRDEAMIRGMDVKARMEAASPKPAAKSLLEVAPKSGVATNPAVTPKPAAKP